MSTSRRLVLIAALALAIALVFALKRDGAEAPGNLPVPTVAVSPDPAEAPPAGAAASPARERTPARPASAPEPAPVATPPTGSGPAPLAGQRPPGDPAATVAKTPADAPRTVAVALPRLVDVGADKCIPCKAMAPILEELRVEYAGRLRVDFIDAWKYPDQAVPFNVYGIPTQIFFDPSGRELYRHVGFFSKEDILSTWRRLGFSLTPGKG